MEILNDWHKNLKINHLKKFIRKEPEDCKVIELYHHLRWQLRKPLSNRPLIYLSIQAKLISLARISKLVKESKILHKPAKI